MNSYNDDRTKTQRKKALTIIILIVVWALVESFIWTFGRFLDLKFETYDTQIWGAAVCLTLANIVGCVAAFFYAFPE